jgi:CRP-like cAMP-binding protein
MPDFNPIVLRRMLALRQFPLFGGAELAELANVADNVIEAEYAAGAVIAGAGARVPAMHLVLDGRIEARGAAARAWGPREVYGELEVLAERRPAAAAIAATATRTLQLTSTDVGELLEDNFGLLLAALRDLAARLVPARGARPLRALEVPRVESLGLVERLIVLRQQVPFAHGHLQALAMLAHASEELSFPAGAVLARAGDPAAGSLVVLDGQLAARGPDGSARVLGPGDVVGNLETLAGLRHERTLEAVTPVRALRSGETAIFDALEDHTDFGLAIIARLAGALLDLPAVEADRGGN